MGETMKKKWLAISSAVVLTLGAAACSGSGTDSSSGESSADTSASGGETASTDNDFSGSSDSKFCKTARELDEKVESLDGLGDAPTPDAVKKAFEESINAYDTILKDAPDEIEADMKFVIEKVEDAFKIIKDNDYDLLKAFSDPKLQEFANNEDFQRRSDKVDDYLFEVCGVGNGAGETVGS